MIEGDGKKQYNLILLWTMIVFEDDILSPVITIEDDIFEGLLCVASS